jgi:AcrR family transcriptional regulator
LAGGAEMLTRTENAIIDAFNKLIEKIDFNKISVDMILTAANVSRSTFYRYFKDKYEVMNANYKHLLDYLVAPERSSGYRPRLIFSTRSKSRASAENSIS